MAAKRTHGMTGTSIYKTWREMRARCNDPTHKNYGNYGGRGITVCASWQASFAAFYADMGDRPSRLHTIDRVDNDGPYSPTNCRWATALQQTRNRRVSVNITHNGKTLALKEWCDRFGVEYTLAHNRIVRRGWSFERAMNQGVRQVERRDGQTTAKLADLSSRGLSQREIAEITGVPQSTISRLLQSRKDIPDDATNETLIFAGRPALSPLTSPLVGERAE